MAYIDKEIYHINKDNFIKRKTKKDQIIISFSLRKKDNHITHLKHKEYGKTKKWNTYTISRNGTIYEHYDPNYYSNFMNMKKINKKSISIVLENMCSLIKINENSYVNWLNEKCPTNKIIKKSFLGLHYWELIPDEQFKSVIDLCDKLCDRFNIPKKIIDFHHYNSNIDKFSGIVLKSNYVENTTTINPLFNLQKFNEMLQLD